MINTEIRMTKTARRAAKALAVRYHGFMQAVAEKNDNGKIVWGKLLLLSIAETGVDLGDTKTIQSIVDRCIRNEGQAQ